MAASTKTKANIQIFPKFWSFAKYSYAFPEKTIMCYGRWGKAFDFKGMSWRVSLGLK